MTIYLIMGPPGSGKGTLSAFLEEKGVQKCALGEILRQEVRSGSPLGDQLKHYVNQGQLIPDELAWTLAEQKISQLIKTTQPFLIEGFPSTREQWNRFFAYAKMHHLLKRIQLIQLECSNKTAYNRMLGRLTCRNCEALFHQTTRPPQQEGTCDRCGGQLFHRTEDAHKTAPYRILNYRHRTVSIIEEAQEHLTLTTIDTEDLDLKTLQELAEKGLK